MAVLPSLAREFHRASMINDIDNFSYWKWRIIMSRRGSRHIRVVQLRKGRCSPALGIYKLA